MVISLVLVAIPVIAWLLLRRFTTALVISSFLGIAVLWGNMIRLETLAEDSDFDIIFCLAMLFWGFVLCAAYTVAYVTTAIFRHLFAGPADRH